MNFFASFLLMSIFNYDEYIILVEDWKILMFGIFMYIEFNLLVEYI